MPLNTIAEADNYSREMLYSAVVDHIIKANPMLALMRFLGIVGNSLDYDRETTAATASWLDPGETWPESTPTVTKKTAKVRILGGDADIDNFLASTRRNPMDLTAEIIEKKSKAVGHEWGDSVIYGSNAVNSKQIDGLHTIITAAAIDTPASTLDVHAGSGSTGGVGKLSLLDEMIDIVKPGKPSALLASKRSLRGIYKLQRSQGSAMEHGDLGFGLRVTLYNNIPLLPCDFIVDTETIASNAFSAKTGGLTSSILAVQLDAPDGVIGLEGGSGDETGLVVKSIGDLETKDAKRYRIKAYWGMAVLRAYAIARLDGISSGDWTN